MSHEVARQLDAAKAAGDDSIGAAASPLLTLGAHFTVMGIPVVSDLPTEDVLDIRS